MNAELHEFFKVLNYYRATAGVLVEMPGQVLTGRIFRRVRHQLHLRHEDFAYVLRLEPAMYRDLELNKISHGESVRAQMADILLNRFNYPEP